MRKYQLDYKDQAAVVKFHENQQLKKIHTEYLKRNKTNRQTLRAYDLLSASSTSTLDIY